MLGSLYAILKFLRFDDVYRRRIKKFLPKEITRWVRVNSEKFNPLPLVNVKELQPKFEKACQFLTNEIGAENIGDYLEFGVCHGTSFYCMFQTLQESNLNHVRLFGFDSFQGLPPIAAIDIENELQPGEYASSLATTIKRLTQKGIDWSRTFLIKGWYENTLTCEVIKQHGIKKASLIMIDCDLYSSAKDSLNFCLPLIKDTSIIFFDDWSEVKNIGEKRAYAEFLSENPQLKSERIDSYKHNGSPCGQIFRVTAMQT